MEEGAGGGGGGMGQGGKGGGGVGWRGFVCRPRCVTPTGFLLLLFDSRLDHRVSSFIIIIIVIASRTCSRSVMYH